MVRAQQDCLRFEGKLARASTVGDGREDLLSLPCISSDAEAAIGAVTIWLMPILALLVATTRNVVWVVIR